MSVRPVQILLVDDNPGDVRLTIEAFHDGKLANEIVVVGDGEEALARLRREGAFAGVPLPDLILLDLNLPNLSGQEVLAILRADPVLADIPVVVLTVSRQEQDVLRSLGLGACAYMTKPVDVSQLIQLVDDVDSLYLSVVLDPAA